MSWANSHSPDTVGVSFFTKRFPTLRKQEKNLGGQGHVGVD